MTVWLWYPDTLENYKNRRNKNEGKIAHGHKFSTEENKTLGSGWFCVWECTVCQASVCVINWKAESAVYVISLAAQGLVSAWNLFRTDVPVQFEPNFYWVAPAEIDPAF